MHVDVVLLIYFCVFSNTQQSQKRNKLNEDIGNVDNMIDGIATVSRIPQDKKHRKNTKTKTKNIGKGSRHTTRALPCYFLNIF